MLIRLFMSLELLQNLLLLLVKVAWNDYFKFNNVISSQLLHIIVIRRLERGHSMIFKDIL
jgi:hypothetical protein